MREARIVHSRLLNQIGSRLARRMPSLVRFALCHYRSREFRVFSVAGVIFVTRPARAQAIVLARSSWIYVADILKDFDYYYNSVVRTDLVLRGARYAVADFSKPTEHAVTGFDDFPVLTPSFMEPVVTAEQYLEFAALRPGQVALDLGCYVGLTSILMSKAVGREGMVVAVEPDPRNHMAAQHNIGRHCDVNGFSNIELIQVAITAEAGDIRFSSEGAMGSAVQDVVGAGRGRSIRVPGRTLDELASQVELKRVDFVKMDIEGSETDVVLASESFVRRFRPKMVIEPHRIDGVLSCDRVCRCLSSYGYTCRIVPQLGVSTLPLILALPTTA